MKSKSKQELADGAGVTVKTLMNWLQPHMEELRSMGLKPKAKVLPPHIAAWICDKFSIDV